MELAQLAQLGEFVGGIAVLVTLVYLAVQVRQNTNAVVTTSHHQMNAAVSWTEGVDHRTTYHPCEGFAQASLAYCWGNARVVLSRMEEGLKLFAVSGEVEA